MSFPNQSPGAQAPDAFAPPPTLQAHQFATVLQESINKAFNPHPTVYEKVNVLFLKWKNTDLDVDALERELAEAFTKTWQFSCDFFTLDPAKGLSAQLELNEVIVRLGKTHGGEKNLLIIVYSGHGKLDDLFGRRTLKIASRMGKNGNLVEPCPDWTHSTAVLNGIGDILHILDCCAAASAFTELDCDILAASSANSSAESDPSKSFTRALIDTILATKGNPLTALELYRTIARLKRDKLLYYTPVYVPGKRKGIVLQAPRTAKAASKMTVPNYKVSPDGPRALLTVQLQEDFGKGNLEKLQGHILSNVPKEVTGLQVKFEGAFKSESTILQFSVPIEIWAAIGTHPSFGFVGFVNSPNLLIQPPSPVADAGHAPSRIGEQEVGFFI